jgi:hypothetical protein
VVNGALEYLSKDLGIAENTVLQGTIFLKKRKECTQLVVDYFKIYTINV